MNATTQTSVLLAGLSLFVPLPFVDEWLYRKALRKALAEDALLAGAELPEAALTVLTEDRSSLMMGCLRSAVVWPLKKLFRTVFFVFTIKDVIDGWTSAAEVVAMVRIAREQGWLPDQARAVRDAIEVAFGKHRWSPITRFIMRYERPVLVEPAASGLPRLFQALRRHAGAVALETVFAQRVRDEMAAVVPAPALPPPAG